MPRDIQQISLGWRRAGERGNLALWLRMYRTFQLDAAPPLHTESQEAACAACGVISGLVKRRNSAQ